MCSVPGCTYADDIDGHRALAGRRELWDQLRKPFEPDDVDFEVAAHQLAEGCQCSKCWNRTAAQLTPEPGMTAADADGALDHVSDRMAVLSLLGYAEFIGCETCSWCGRPSPLWRDRPDCHGLIKSGGCPYHWHLDRTA